jgi:hypothetical protein
MTSVRSTRVPTNLLHATHNRDANVNCKRTRGNDV